MTALIDARSRFVQTLLLTQLPENLELFDLVFGEVPQVPYRISIFPYPENSTLRSLGPRRRWSFVACHYRRGL